MAFSLGNMNLADPKSDGLLMTLDSVGLMSLLSADDATIGAMHKTVATWVGNPGVQKLMSETRQAEMALVAHGKDSQCAEAVDARKKISEFRDELRAALLGVKTVLLEQDFKLNQVAPAMDIFKLWLKRYELPDIPVSIHDLGNTTLEKAALNHFSMRIATMQKKVAEDPGTTEPLLSAEYLKEFTSYLNGLGRNVILTNLQARLLNEKVNEIIEDPGNADIYNVRAQVGDEAEAQVRRDVTTLNLYGLTGHVNHILDKAKKILKGFAVSLEDMKRWNEVIEREFKNLIGRDSQTLSRYNEYAVSRMNMMTAIDFAVVSGPNAIGAIVDDVLMEYFGGKNILDEKVIDQNFLGKHRFSVVQLVAAVKEAVMDEVKKRIESLKATAMAGGKPGDDLAPLPNRKQLKAIFRDVAKATVKAIAGTKKSVYAEQLKLIGSKIRSDDKKAVVGKFKDDSPVKA